MKLQRQIPTQAPAHMETISIPAVFLTVSFNQKYPCLILRQGFSILTGYLWESLSYTKKTGNPVFNVENTSTLKTAVDEAFSLYNTGYGEKNRRYALENWRISLIAQKQYMYYKELLHLTNINIGRGGALNLPVQFPYNTEAA